MTYRSRSKNEADLIGMVVCFTVITMLFAWFWWDGHTYSKNCEKLCFTLGYAEYNVFKGYGFEERKCLCRLGKGQPWQTMSIGNEIDDPYPMVDEEWPED